MVPRNQKWLLVLILVLLGGLVLFVIIDRNPALPAAIILPPTSFVVKSGRVPDRWIPRKWNWLRRTCFFILGQPRQVEFDVECFEANESVASIVAENSLGQPQAQSNGVAVWMLPAREGLRQAKAPTKIMPRGRLSTSDRGEARLGVGDYTADLFGRLQKKTVDLSTRVIVGSATQTNFVAAVRARLPYDQALFVLDVRLPESTTNRFEILITADELDAKGYRVHSVEVVND